MIDPTIAALEGRIERLEHRNSALLGICMIAACFLVLSAFEDNQEVVRANELIILGPAGQPQASLSGSADGAVLNLRDPHGRSRIVLHAADRTSIAVLDGSERVRAELSYNPELERLISTRLVVYGFGHRRYDATPADLLDNFDNLAQVGASPQGGAVSVTGSGGMVMMSSSIQAGIGGIRDGRTWEFPR